MKFEIKRPDFAEIEIASNGNLLKGKIYNSLNLPISKYTKLRALVDKMQKETETEKIVNYMIDILALCIEGITKEDIEKNIIMSDMYEIVKYIFQAEVEKKTDGTIS